MSQNPKVITALPVPFELTLRNFSLYENQTVVSVQFGEGVFCLAGANGLGKSTFLNALNYAITGVVAEPGRKFDSLREYYKNILPYARSYFDGRVERSDRELASVKVRLQAGSAIYTIERKFFETESLTFFEIERNGIIEVSDGDFASDSDRNRAYMSHIIKDCGLAEFSQLVFLQHFLLTFDEQHRLLLWDERTIEQALLLSLGVDAAAAAEADQHRRKAERLDSQARNLQYQASTAEGRIQDLKDRVSVDEAENREGEDSFERLEAEWESLSSQLARISGELEASQTIEADAHSRLATLEQAYEDAFANLMSSSPQNHPLVLSSIQSDRCDLCGSDHAAARISGKLDSGLCPMCDATNLPNADISDLDGIREHLAAAKAEARRSTQSVSELVGLRQSVLKEMTEKEAAKARLESGESDAAALSQATVRRLITQYELEAQDARDRRDEFRRRRDSHRQALKPIARDLAVKYASAEERFVPRFIALAHQFLGLDVDVFLQQRGARASIVVTVEGTERRTFDRLSESQRYFLDIALRMALVEYMSAGQGGCLYVDTPEGSLDISYEARAGEMFADFAAANNKLIMTANINTSQLLLSLAKRSNPSTMQIGRMMEWTALSDVQAEGEKLFTEAFGKLREALLSEVGPR